MTTYLPRCPFHILCLGTLASLGLYQSCKIICKHLHKKIDLERFEVDKRFTNAIRYGDLVFISGQVGEEGANITEQSEQALKEVDRALAQAGTDKEHVVECTVWLADMKDYNAFNEVYDKWIVPGKPPTRACVEAKLYSPHCKVEVRVIAATSK